MVCINRGKIISGIVAVAIPALLCMNALKTRYERKAMPEPKKPYTLFYNKEKGFNESQSETRQPDSTNKEVWNYVPRSSIFSTMENRNWYDITIERYERQGDGSFKLTSRNFNKYDGFPIWHSSTQFSNHHTNYFDD